MVASFVSHGLRFELRVPCHTYLNVLVILARALYVVTVTVLFLASATNGSGGQSAMGGGGESIPFRSVSVSDLT